MVSAAAAEAACHIQAASLAVAQGHQELLLADLQHFQTEDSLHYSSRSRSLSPQFGRINTLQHSSFALNSITAENKVSR